MLFTAGAGVGVAALWYLFRSPGLGAFVLLAASAVLITSSAVERVQQERVPAPVPDGVDADAAEWRNLGKSLLDGRYWLRHAIWFAIVVIAVLLFEPTQLRTAAQLVLTLYWAIIVVRTGAALRRRDFTAVTSS